jgi:arylformamidase
MNIRETAPSADRAKGPLVWLDMDQKALDDAYDQAVYAPNRDIVHARNEFNSERVRARLGEPQRVAYGPTAIEQLDIFRTKAAKAPVNVFIHGGAWRLRQVKDYAFMAETYVNNGAHFVGLDFTGVDKTGGDLRPMVDQVRRALVWVWKNAASFGGDPDRIYISSQSSGAHLGGVMCVTEWEKLGAPKDMIKGALLCSGMYDLKPVRLSKRSSYVNFDDEIEQTLSSQRHLDKLNCPVIVAYGTCETPEFQRQNREFAAAVKAAGKPVTLLVGEGYNHFEMPEMLANPYSLLGRAVLEQMGLAK